MLEIHNNKIVKHEDSYTQFKLNITDSKKLAEEMVAFSNAEGGELLLGISDDGTITGLTDRDISRLNQLISNTANEICKPPIYPLTEVVIIDGRKIIIIKIKKGSNKPYCTSSGLYITKSGSDKRKISQTELKRLFAEGGNIFADEETIIKSSIKDLNMEHFYRFLEKSDKQILNELNQGLLSLEIVLANLDLMNKQYLTLAGNLLFGLHPQRFNRSFYIDCVYFDGNDISASNYITKDQAIGSFVEIFKQTMNFLKSNLKKKQSDTNFNSPAKLEIPEEVLVEFIVNALVHRDYYINSSVKVFIFNNRVEIISPGKLPNSLTVEKIKRGISIHRNPVLSSLSKNILPYSGFGSGIKRSFSMIGDDITLINETETEQFICIIKRK